MSYKYGDWYCKPANESEAKEIIERAVASGAQNINGWRGNSTHYQYGVINGLVDYGVFDCAEYTIEQLREKFPLPCEQAVAAEKLSYAKQQYPLGAQVEVCMNGVWHKATVNGQAGDYIIARADGYWYDEYLPEDVRPLRTKRERWVEQALEHFCDDDGTETMERIYDALKSGTLKAPEVE